MNTVMAKLNEYIVKSLILSLTGSAVVLISPLAVNAQQFNNSGYLDNWFNQAMPQSSATMSPLPSSTAVASSTSSQLNQSFNPSLQTPISQVQTLSIGVYVEDYEVGALIKRIEPNSPAQRAGLKPEDLIVAVNGQQVGYTPLGYVDVGLQASRSAVEGKVTALIADGRTGKLQNVPIELQQSAVRVSGTVRLNERVSLPDSYLKVAIRNVSRPFYEVHGGSITTVVRGPGPFNFELMIDAKTILAQDQYDIIAEVTDARGNILYRMMQPLAINPRTTTTPLLLNLDNYRQLLAQSGNGQVVQASFSSQLDTEFQNILGRGPSANERFYWTKYINEGNSIDDLRISLLASNAFYDISGNNASNFVRNMIAKLARTPATNQQVDQWTQKLAQLQYSRDALVREFMQASSGTLR